MGPYICNLLMVQKKIMSLSTYLTTKRKKRRKNNEANMVKSSNLENLGERYTRILCTVL